MHDIWNPWHGCKKCSEGCAHCYMYFLDASHGRTDSSVVTRTAGFYYRTGCVNCGSRLICNGCSDCGRCGGEIIDMGCEKP